MADRFRVERVEALRFSGPDDFTRCELVSPYVWRHLDGSLGVLVRAVPGGDASTGSIWYGRSDDGLSIKVEDTPVLSPDADGPDAKGARIRPSSCMGAS